MGERRSNAPDEGCLTAPPLEALLRKEGRRLELEITRKAPVKGEIFHFFLSRTSPLPPPMKTARGLFASLGRGQGWGRVVGQMARGSDGQTDSQMDGQTAGQRAQQGLRKGSGAGGKGRARGRAAPGLTGDLGPNPGQQLLPHRAQKGLIRGERGGNTPASSPASRPCGLHPPPSPPLRAP